MTIMRYNLPLAMPGQVVGLLGGSFDPPHEGHVHISHQAISRFALDRLWWLVTPGNPLKRHGPQPLADRLRAARDLVRHPRIEVTDIERHLNTRYTADTLRKLHRLYPGTRFVWIMGADNLASFHDWQDWEDIMANVPVGIMARPGERIAARTSVAAQKYRSAKLPAIAAKRLALRNTPRWCFVNVPMKSISSTRLRAAGHWG